MGLKKLSLIILLLITTAVKAENNHHVFAAWEGNTPGASINYEYHLWKNLWVGSGVGYYSGRPFNDDTKITAIGVPVMINGLWGDGQHKLETGVGATYLSDTAEDSFDSLTSEGSGILPMATLGYRYMQENGFTLRAIGVAALSEFGPRFSWGIGIGYAF